MEVWVCVGLHAVDSLRKVCTQKEAESDKISFSDPSHLEKRKKKSSVLVLAGN